ncbi:MAG TPA: hemerythrin domain-containing protein [Kofleriaceae bacterium]|jgi:hemerythrin-like domain-containing protein
MNFERYTPRGLEAMDANGPRLLFAEHHRELERACKALLARAYEGDCHSLLDQYRPFEQHVLEHMRAEEEAVLPYFEKEHAQEAAEIRAAHEKLRRRLESTACDLELHSARIDNLRELVTELRQHAAEEDRVMYPWAQVHLPVPALRASWERLMASLRHLIRLGT